VRVVIDLKPAEQAQAEEGLVVVLEPRPHSVHTYPLTVRGYARTFEANVIARVRVDGRLEVETFTTAASWAETWGQFEITIEDGPLGEIELFLGEDPARGGPEEGVYIDLTMVP
jgi:hypothetical protein